MVNTPFSNLVMTRMKLREPSKYKLTNEDIRDMSDSKLPVFVEIQLFNRFVEGE